MKLEFYYNGNERKTFVPILRLLDIRHNFQLFYFGMLFDDLIV